MTLATASACPSSERPRRQPRAAPGSGQALAGVILFKVRDRRCHSHTQRVADGAGGRTEEPRSVRRSLCEGVTPTPPWGAGAPHSRARSVHRVRTGSRLIFPFIPTYLLTVLSFGTRVVIRRLRCWCLSLLQPWTDPPGPPTSWALPAPRPAVCPGLGDGAGARKPAQPDGQEGVWSAGLSRGR